MRSTASPSLVETHFCPFFCSSEKNPSEKKRESESSRIHNIKKTKNIERTECTFSVRAPCPLLALERRDESACKKARR